MIETGQDSITSRLPGEGNRAFEAYCVYRDLGPGRSIEAAARLLNKSKQILARYSTTFDWVGRTRAFDNAVDEARVRAKLLEAAREGARSAALWEARKQETLEEFYEASVALKRTGDAMLRCPVLIEREDPEGGTFLEPVGRWSFRDASTLLKTSIEIRTALFEAATKPLDGLSDLELLAISGLEEMTAETPPGDRGEDQGDSRGNPARGR